MLKKAVIFEKILNKSGKKQPKFFIKPTKICLIVDCMITPLLIDYFYKNRLIAFKEIIDYLIIN